MLKLSNQQIQDLLNTKATAEDGLNDILKMTLNAIMYSERKEFLRLKNNKENKANGYRPIKVQGYGKLLQLAIPRDRLAMFKPIFMLHLEDENKNLQNMCFELYKEGLTTSKISKILDKVFHTKYSKSSISNMSQTFCESLKQWRERKLDNRYVALYIDAIHAKVRRETVQGEAFCVALGVREDFTREVIAMYNSPTESAAAWEEVLKDIKQRGVEKIDLVVADGLPGLEEKVLTHFPEALFQKCVTHLKRNILTKIRPQDKPAMVADLECLFDVSDNTHTKEKAYTIAADLREKWGKKYPALKKMLDPEALRPYLTCLDFNFKIRTMIYTTNWIERLNKEFRRALKIRNAMPSVDSVLFLLSAIARDMEEGTYSYPVSNLGYEPKFLSQDMTLMYHE